MSLLKYYDKVKFIKNVYYKNFTTSIARQQSGMMIFDRKTKKIQKERAAKRLFITLKKS